MMHCIGFVFLSTRGGNNPPAKGNGKPCDRFNETRFCNEDPCKPCVVDGQEYSYGQVISKQECDFWYVELIDIWFSVCQRK